MVCPSLILLCTVPVSSELKKQAEKPITGSEKRRSLPMRETIRNFPERARNFHPNSSDICGSGTSRWFKFSVMQDWKQECSGKRRKKLSGKGIWRAGGLNSLSCRNVSRNVQDKIEKNRQERVSGRQDFINSTYFHYLFSMNTVKDHTCNRLVNFNT